MVRTSEEKLISIINYYKEKNLNETNEEYKNFYKNKYESYIKYSKANNIIVEPELKKMTTEEYIENICKDENIKTKLNNYKNELEKNFDKNELLNVTWLKNYKSFVELNNLNKKHMINYANLLLQNMGLNEQNNINDKFELITTKKTKEKQFSKEDKEETNNLLDSSNELKIKSVKKAKYDNTKSTIYSFLAILGISSFGLIGLIATSPLIRKAYKNIKYQFKINAALKKHNLMYTKDGVVLNSKGEVLSEKNIDKETYNIIKQELFKIENEKEPGKISKIYKKNKLTSKLLNNKMVVNLANKLKFKKDEPEETIEIQEMKKGLGVVK